MVQLYDADEGALLGEISEEQFEFLSDELEEESLADRDYYISTDTVDMLEEDGADAELIRTLREALAGRDGMDVRWKRD